MLRRFVYDEPYTKTCHKRVCVPIVGCKNVPYPCAGLQRKSHEVYLVATWSDETTPTQAILITQCGQASVPVALESFTAAYAASVGAGGPVGIVAGIAAGITSATVAARVSFDTCKQSAGIPYNIARKAGIAIRHEKHNRGLDPDEYRDDVQDYVYYGYDQHIYPQYPNQYYR